MRFLFDQSADFRLIPHLRERGHDVHVISRNCPHGLPDEDVLKIAREEGRILIVADRDFGELIFQQELAHAGIIFFRLPGAQLQIKIDQLNKVYPLGRKCSEVFEDIKDHCILHHDFLGKCNYTVDAAGVK